MKIEISPARYQVRFYDDNGKYRGSMNVETHGPRAIIDSLAFTGFLKYFDMIWEFININCGTSIWHAHIVPEHLEPYIKTLGDTYKVDVLSTEEHAGREMVWIEVTKPDWSPTALP